MRRVIACLGAGALSLLAVGCDDTSGGPGPASDTGGPPIDAMLDGPDPIDMDVPPPAPGAPCQSPSECESGLCLSTARGGLCTVPCATDGDDCPDGWFCGEHVAFTDPVCQPPRGLCGACEGDAQCGGVDDLCLPLLGAGGATFCARDCADRPCPDGFECRTLGADRQCQPVDDVCAGEIVECPDAFGPDRDADGSADGCDACPDLPGEGPDGCPPGGGLRFLGGQVVGAASEHRVGRFTLRLVGGAREPLPRTETRTLQLGPLSLGRNP
ncbi:MAG: hypothetical protein R3F65_15275 [bacterium]